MLSSALSQTRAMETAVGSFGGPVWHEGDAELPLMAEVAGGDFSTAHPAVSSRGTPPFVAYELCREHLGGHMDLTRHRCSVDCLKVQAPCKLLSNDWLSRRLAACVLR